MGRGHLAMTVDQGAGMHRYQGLVPLDGSTLSEIAHSYFIQSEQIPTRIYLGVTPSVSTKDGAFSSGWRAGGVLLQFLPTSPDRQKMAELAPGDAPEGFVPHEHSEDDAWTTARALADTIAHDELVDPDLSPETLLYRLFHEQGVRVFDAQPILAFCRCSPERVGTMLKSFTPEEKAHMLVEGEVRVTCEFCSRTYSFPASALET
jgi:molecular chaperone Hsp33